MKDILKVVVPTVIVGIASAALTVQISVAVIRTELEFIKSDMVDLKQVLKIVNENQLSNERLSVITATNSNNIARLWDKVETIKDK
tara:strand:+ start:1325 stop:1582 length:258 start_codon:yes stop_codon:yes gene_type:complete